MDLVHAFGWSLREIDETDIESMFPFIARFGNADSGSGNSRTITTYADQVDWL